ncbi:hypothetical protein Tco_0983055 [Tanacetum coccineum]
MIQKGSKVLKFILDRVKDLTECLNTSFMKFKISISEKHEVKQVQQTCLGEDCWELCFPDLVPLVVIESTDSYSLYLSVELSILATTLNRLERSILNWDLHVGLDPRTEVYEMSIHFAPTGWCRIEEVPRCSLRGARWYSCSPRG